MGREICEHGELIENDCHMCANTWKAPNVKDAYKIGAKGGPVVEAERLAFEAYMSGHNWAISATWDGETYRGSAEHGNYLCPHAMNVRTLWAAWRDRAALANAACWANSVAPNEV